MEYRIRDYSLGLDELAYGEAYVMSPLHRMLVAPLCGVVYTAFRSDTNALRKYGQISHFGLPAELEAEYLYAHGHHAACIQLSLKSPAALQIAADIDLENCYGVDKFNQSGFVALAQSIRAQKLIKNVMSEIQNGRV